LLLLAVADGLALDEVALELRTADELGDTYVLKDIYELVEAFELVATYCLASTWEDETTEVEDEDGDEETGVSFAYDGVVKELVASASSVHVDDGLESLLTFEDEFFRRGVKELVVGTASFTEELGVFVSTGTMVSQPSEVVFVYSRRSGTRVGAPYQVVVYE